MFRRPKNHQYMTFWWVSDVFLFEKRKDSRGLGAAGLLIYVGTFFLATWILKQGGSLGDKWWMSKVTLLRKKGSKTNERKKERFQCLRWNILMVKLWVLLKIHNITRPSQWRRKKSHLTMKIVFFGLFYRGLPIKKWRKMKSTCTRLGVFFPLVYATWVIFCCYHLSFEKIVD